MIEILVMKEFFQHYLAAPRSTSGHSRGNSLTNPNLITAIVKFQPEVHWKPRNSESGAYLCFICICIGIVFK